MTDSPKKRAHLPQHERDARDMAKADADVAKFSALLEAAQAKRKALANDIRERARASLAAAEGGAE